MHSHPEVRKQAAAPLSIVETFFTGQPPEGLEARNLSSLCLCRYVPFVRRLACADNPLFIVNAVTSSLLVISTI